MFEIPGQRRKYNFNARIGSLKDMSDDSLTNLPQRKNIDATINSHGKQLVDFRPERLQYDYT